MYFDQHLIRLMQCVNDGTYNMYPLSPDMQAVAESDPNHPLPDRWYQCNQSDVEAAWGGRCMFLLRESRQMILGHTIESLSPQSNLDRLFLLEEVYDHSQDCCLYGYLINQLVQVYWNMLKDLDDKGWPSNRLVEAIEQMTRQMSVIEPTP